MNKMQEIKEVITQYIDNKLHENNLKIISTKYIDVGIIEFTIVPSKKPASIINIIAHKASKAYAISETLKTYFYHDKMLISSASSKKKTLEYNDPKLFAKIDRTLKNLKSGIFKLNMVMTGSILTMLMPPVITTIQFIYPYKGYLKSLIIIIPVIFTMTFLLSLEIQFRKNEEV